MSDSFGQSPERPRPTYGQPAEGQHGGTAGHSGVPGPSGAMPQYGAGSQNGSAPQYGAPAQNGAGSQYGSAPQGTSAPYHKQNGTGAQNSGWTQGQQVSAPGAAQQSEAPAPHSPFGGYGTPPNQTGQGQAPKKRKPVGLVLTVLGVIGMVLGGVLIAVGLWKGFGGVMDGLDALTAESTNSTLAGNTATFESEVSPGTMFMVLVPAADAEAATCTAVTESGASLTTTPSDSNPDLDATQINGVNYNLYESIFVSESESGPVTLTCDNVSAPVAVVGPIDSFGMLGWMVALPLIGLGVGFVGFCLLIAGIIVMLVRARRNRQAA